MSLRRYNIYPSLLDKFQAYLDADKAFESPWNIDPDGNYKRSAEEIEAELKQSLLDSINRVPHEPIEAADKGTCFNALVDHLNGAKSDIPFARYEATERMPAFYTAQLNGFTFCFNAAMVEAAADYFSYAIPQFRTQASIMTAYGEVTLYGYIDEICMGVVKDIKTTSRYDFGKFADHWQRYVYPYCLVASGRMPAVEAFEFTVFVWIDRAGQPLDAKMFKEEYTFSMEEATTKVRQICERFIDFLELNRELITDKKIFGEE